MQVIRTEIPDVLVLEPKVFGDERGFFMEAFNRRTFAELVGTEIEFVQDNHSGSRQNVLRGLHYQVEQAQGKLVRVVQGEIWDVVVDVRSSSVTFGKHVSVTLSAENHRMMWIPAGFAHGFIARAEWNEVVYKATDYWAPQHERTLLWSDPELQIVWPLEGQPILAKKDAEGKPLREAEVYP
jgi:dTDP-4-dehydrorhamnose 3,5-epimerase